MDKVVISNLDANKPELFYALIRECYKNFGPYRVETFSSCDTKEDVLKVCRQKSYVICDDYVYTEDEWNAE